MTSCLMKGQKLYFETHEGPFFCQVVHVFHFYFAHVSQKSDSNILCIVETVDLVFLFVAYFFSIY